MAIAVRSIVVAMALIFVGVTLYVIIQSQSITPTYSCIADEDCVPAQCCHPTSAVNKKFAPNCAGIACTQVCQPGTIDCNQGRIACVRSRCEAIIYPQMPRPNASKQSI